MNIGLTRKQFLPKTEFNLFEFSCNSNKPTVRWLSVHGGHKQGDRSVIAKRERCAHGAFKL